tara:strand:- start:5809 stop:6759 length:951 start_codon:yes stop_codon:yes gene_type:complete
MKAVILAAGKSTRTFPLTLDKPKPLIPLADKPLLAWNLDQLQGLVDEVVIVVGYKKEMIRAAFGDEYHGLPLKYVVQEDQEGTGHALLTARDLVGEEFVVLNGDDLYAAEDIEAISKKKNCLLAREVDDASKYGALRVRDGKIEEIVEKPKHYVSNLINLGLYKFTADIFPFLENIRKSPRGEYEIIEAINDLAKTTEVEYLPLQDYWLPVGYPHQVIEANNFLLQRYYQTSVLKGPGAIVGDSQFAQVTLGRGSIVGNDVKIKNSVIFPGAEIADNCIVEDSIIGDNVVLKPGTVVKGNCVVSSDSQLVTKAINR